MQATDHGERHVSVRRVGRTRQALTFRVVKPALKRYRSVVADSSRWEGFTFRPGDIVISTPPKCGTTWMQRLVALLVFDGPGLPAPMAKVSPWLDMQLASTEDVMSTLDAQTHRRFIKTHTPLDGLPFGESVTYICVGRDPRDVAVSSRHHMQNMDVERFLAIRAAAVGLEDLAELGLNEPGPPEPLDDAAALRAWIDADSDVTVMTLAFTVRHLLSFWEAGDQPSVALFHYADLLADLPGQLQRLAAVLGYGIDPQRAEDLSAEASFEAMKGQAEHVVPNADIGLWRSAAGFLHRGTSGQWKEAFTDDDLARYEARVGELAPADFLRWLHGGGPT
jgi:aryl sulfotransferase